FCPADSCPASAVDTDARAAGVCTNAVANSARTDAPMTDTPRYIRLPRRLLGMTVPPALESTASTPEFQNLHKWRRVKAVSLLGVKRMAHPGPRISRPRP